MIIVWNNPYSQDDWTCEECGLYEWDCICPLDDDGNEWHEAFFNSTADAFLGTDDKDEQ